ncbi:MAG: di-trans,poly-cis-decaprenylcistransferase [Leptonema sp. (in: Bacteria)]|nr:di-trans,poly-cis-decaprenylcistransferase [Leptonema sp. (in: bacteria)]
MTQAQPTIQHVAIILDGNGRWAKSRGLSRTEGHREGGKALHRLLDRFLEENIGCVSLYAFSTENWKRPETEVSFLWNLMNEFFERHIDECRQKDIRIISSGDISDLPESNQKILKRSQEVTANCNRLIANFCLNYGSRQEITRAAHQVLLERLMLERTGKSSDAEKPISIQEIESHLYTADLPAVDLLIRPGGEFRLSNFLLWQSAYTELYFTDRFWPDFSADDLRKALEWFNSRERRFGGLS